MFLILSVSLESWWQEPERIRRSWRQWAFTIFWVTLLYRKWERLGWGVSKATMESRELVQMWLLIMENNRVLNTDGKEKERERGRIQKLSLSRQEGIGEGNRTPLQYSCLDNPMDGGDWWAAVHGVGKSRTRLSDVTFTFHFHALEKEMATHSSVLAWRIPGTGQPGGLPSMGSHRVRHDWSDLAAAAAAAGKRGWWLQPWN